MADLSGGNRVQTASRMSLRARIVLGLLKVLGAGLGGIPQAM